VPGLGMTALQTLPLTEMEALLKAPATIRGRYICWGLISLVAEGLLVGAFHALAVLADAQ